MSDRPHDVEAMSCEELLRELARLSPELDRSNEQVTTAENARPDQVSQVASMFNQRSRVERIGELIKEKGCEHSQAG